VSKGQTVFRTQASQTRRTNQNAPKNQGGSEVEGYLGCTLILKRVFEGVLGLG